MDGYYLGKNLNSAIHLNFKTFLSPFLSYLQKFYSDHTISTSSPNKDILCYVSKYSSCETGVIIVNKGDVDQVVGVDMDSIGVGLKYYVYSFSGGTNDSDFSQNVYINGYSPDMNQWGPYDELSGLPANSYPIGNGIKINSPARSVQMIMVERGNNYVSVNDKPVSNIIGSFKLFQNYPNPFNPSTQISYQLKSGMFVTLKVYDILGRVVKTLVNKYQNAGSYSVQFNGANLPSRVYFYKLDAGVYQDIKKLLLLR